MNDLQVSVIMWDASFRQRFHTFISLANQTFPHDSYELVWVDYYSNMPEVVKNERASQTSMLCLNGVFPWHAGKCVNVGIQKSRGKIVVIIDADVVVHSKFLEGIGRVFAENDNLVLHVHRWDEPEHHRGFLDWERLSEVCILDNPNNYGSCVAVRREHLIAVNGCDEDPVFQRDSAVFKDLHTRLVNLGLEHRWVESQRLLHPWHPGTKAIAEPRRLRTQKKIICRREEQGIFVANRGKNVFGATRSTVPVEAMRSLWVYCLSRVDVIAQEACYKGLRLAKRARKDVVAFVRRLLGMR